MHINSGARQQLMEPLRYLKGVGGAGSQAALDFLEQRAQHAQQRALIARHRQSARQQAADAMLLRLRSSAAARAGGVALDCQGCGRGRRRGRGCYRLAARAAAAAGLAGHCLRRLCQAGEAAADAQAGVARRRRAAAVLG